LSREFNVGLVPYMMARELVYGSLYLDDAVLLPEENHPNVLNVRQLQRLSRGVTKIIRKMAHCVIS
jgi:hypothetical protein